MDDGAEVDFIVVGSGAGGGPLAFRLAQHAAGYKVAVFESGKDPSPEDGPTNYNYVVPALHGRATEDPTMRLDVFVQHYTQLERQKADSKYYPQPPAAASDERQRGIWYPRAGTLGGCTAHNAMITVYPHDEDWDAIAQLTGDMTWSPAMMRSYFQKLENCLYAPAAPNAAMHGFGGWLSTSLLDVDLIITALKDDSLKAIAVAAFKTLIENWIVSLKKMGPVAQLATVLPTLSAHADILSSLSTLVPAAKRGLMNQTRAVLDQFTALLGKPQVHPDVLGTVGQLQTLLDPASNVEAVVDSLLMSFLNKIPGLSIDDLVMQLIRYLDPNDIRVSSHNLQGLFAIPLATTGVQRNGTREFILQTRANYPYRLELISGALVTRILFDKNKAAGVEYVEGVRFAASDGDLTKPLPPSKKLLARREVVLAGGAFNTPQLLMLSGIGPKDVLDKFQIPSAVPNRYWFGVGKNLQDRYELAVISEMQNDFDLLKDCKFDTPEGSGDDDRCFVEWKTSGTGVYTTNGALFAIILRSSQAEHLVPPPGAVAPKAPPLDVPPPPDLFIFGLAGFFKGYYPKYSADIVKQTNVFTWAILKGHTRNNAGEVLLRSADPREIPLINFKFFDDGTQTPAAKKDLAALVEGVKFVKRMIDRTGKATKLTAWPNVPLDNLDSTGAVKQLEDFIMREAWGHHACGTCRIGNPDDPLAVVDSRFRVLGIENLRVVDASVFPRIPGFFIVTPIYAISEKAAEVILEDAR